MATPSRHAVLTPNANSGEKNLSDLIVDYLEMLGVEYVFGVPGGHISAFFEALERSQQRGGPRMILTRHESGAANMADGYARETGKLGVCCATTGPGATNLITGMASAYVDHTPLLVITGQTALPRFGEGAFQESSPDWLNTAGMMENVTHYSTVVTHPKQFEIKLVKALRYALQSPRGPVHFSYSVDLSRRPVPQGMSYPNLPTLLQRSASYVDLGASAELANTLINTLQSGKRITLLVGHDCINAADDIVAFAEQINAEIATTQNGKTWIDPYHPLVRGVFGYAGHQTARRAITDEDVGLVIALGTRMGQWATSTWDSALLNEKLAHVHPSDQYFSRTPMARVHVQGTVKTVIQQLAARVQNETTLNVTPYEPAEPLPESAYQNVPAQIEVIDNASYHNDVVPIHPQRLVWDLMQRRFPADTRFIVDTTNWMPWTLQYFFTPHQHTYRLSSELAAMGWGIGAAVGTAIGNRGTPVVCLVGDGGFLMAGQEITVAIQEQLPVIYMILNDSSYGMVAHRHQQVVDDPLKFGFPQVDFTMMAKAMGADGITITRPEQLAELDYEAICSRKGPTVLNILIDPDITAPQGMF